MHLETLRTSCDCDLKTGTVSLEEMVVYFVEYVENSSVTVRT